MKKILSIGLLLIITSFSFAQSYSYRKAAPETEWLYLGSVPKEEYNAVKLKIEIIGGLTGNPDIGKSVYTISSRDGLIINLNRVLGGCSDSLFKFKIYETSTGYDFALELIETWASFLIESVVSNIPTTNTVYKSSYIEIKKYDPIGKIDVTNEYQISVFTSSDRAGNIGIGTISPQSKLDVRGKIIADEVEIKVNKGADFVFKPDYILKPLSEVEAFAKENHHLPEVPSEKEMQKNGLNVNDMQIKLLQKIEELTLYMIEQDKRYNDLKKENEVIKQDLKELKKE